MEQAQDALAALANTLSPEAYNALRNIFVDIDHRLTQAQNTAATIQDIQHIFQQALSNAQFTVNTPAPQPPPPPAPPQPRPANIKAELPYFRAGILRTY
ncbi:hypothetical protein GLOTRDRAFT_127065, partial [Gloeophyllum trabeum ATCC 11539]